MSKSTKVRAANEQIVDEAERLHFVYCVPLLCECDDPACSGIIALRLDEYHHLRSNPHRFVTSPGHTLDDAQPQETGDRYWIQHRQPA